MKNIKVLKRKYSCGSYSFYDFLYINSSEKKMILKKSIMYSENDKPVSTTPNFIFKKRYNLLLKKGYIVEIVDGGMNRTSVEEVLKAIHLDFNKEKIYELSNSRLEKYDYYSLTFIRRACRLFVQDLIDDSFFYYWTNLYIFALAESYYDIDNMKKKIFIESVITILGGFNIVLSNSINREDKKKNIREMYKNIKNIDSSFKEKNHA